MGILKATGAIALSQFWPVGGSDADTTKIDVHVGAGSFEYAADGVNFIRTDVLDDAIAVGKGSKSVVSDGKITVRLQGIDAPELHYRAAALKTGARGVTAAKRAAFNALNAAEHRQNWAESATVALTKHLAAMATDEAVPCIIQSRVDSPSDLVDVYGRVVADIMVGASTVSLNRWLVQNGWAVPTFYSSMSAAEIEVLLEDANAGMRKKRVLSAIVGKVPKFDADLVYRRPSEKPKPQRDAGPLLMPKLFRRQVAYALQKSAKVITGNFKAFLETVPDQVFLTDDFLDVGIHSAQEYFLDMFVTAGGRIDVMPHDLVFKEKPSFVKSPDGRKLEHF